MRVPPPGAVPVVRVPPTDSMRSRRLASPVPTGVVAGSKPMPSSSTRKLSLPSRPVRATRILVALECFAAFCTASRQQKYAVASTLAAYLPTPVAVTSTGITLVARAVVRAGTSPSAPSLAG